MEENEEVVTEEQEHTLDEIYELLVEILEKITNNL